MEHYLSDNSPNPDIICVDLEEDANDAEIIELTPTSPTDNSNLQQLQNTDDIASPIAVNSQSSNQNKAIQQCLALLLHAQRCVIIQEETSEVQIKCVQPHCSSIKDLLKHQENCQIHQHCSVPRCSSSRMILKHWDNCKSPVCPLCSPLRRQFNVQGQSQVQKSRQSWIKPLEKRKPIFPAPNPRETQLLPNPFAASRLNHNHQLESWDDDAPVQVKIISSPPKNTDLTATLNFEFVSTGVTKGGKNLKKPECNCQSRPNKKYWNWYKSKTRTYNNYKTLAQHSKFNHQPQLTADPLDSRPNVEADKIDGLTATQEQMLMLVHAFKCRRDSDLSQKCMNATCKSTKNLLDHMKNCERTIRCWIPRCISSKRILIHVNECRDEKCELCSPLQRSNSSRGGGDDDGESS